MFTGEIFSVKGGLLVMCAMLSCLQPRPNNKHMPPRSQYKIQEITQHRAQTLSGDGVSAGGE